MISSISTVVRSMPTGTRGEYDMKNIPKFVFFPGESAAVGCQSVHLLHYTINIPRKDRPDDRSVKMAIRALDLYNTLYYCRYY